MEASSKDGLLSGKTTAAATNDRPPGPGALPNLPRAPTGRRDVVFILISTISIPLAPSGLSADERTVASTDGFQSVTRPTPAHRREAHDRPGSCTSASACVVEDIEFDDGQCDGTALWDGVGRKNSILRRQLPGTPRSRATPAERPRLPSKKMDRALARVTHRLAAGNSVRVGDPLEGDLEIGPRSLGPLTAPRSLFVVFRDEERLRPELLERSRLSPSGVRGPTRERRDFDKGTLAGPLSKPWRHRHVASCR
jgi:hypothetical protein